MASDNRLGMSSDRNLSDKAVEGYVLSLADHAHAAAQFFDNVVARDSLTDHVCQILRA